MVPRYSCKVPRVSHYSGSRSAPPHFRLRGFHTLRPGFPSGSANDRDTFLRSVPRDARIPVWAPPISLAATFGITVVFSSSAYLDVSVQRVPSAWLWIRHAVPTVFIGGFPHSDIHGSKDMCSSPWLFAACHVLLRLQVPGHSPCALFA